MDHPAQLRGVRALDVLVDAAQAERAQRVALLRVGAVGGLDLADDEAHAGAPVPAGGAGWVCAVSSAGASAVAPASAGASSGSPPTIFTPSLSPSTALTDR